jgi:polyisoprenoid-binding protein YceI
MATWIFEPAHSGAEFRVRHMMVGWVRGMFKEIHGRLELDPDQWLDATFTGEIDARGIWTGQADRDAHLRGADFLDVARYPTMTFSGRFVERTSPTTFKGAADLSIRDVTRRVTLDIVSLGEWTTPLGIGDADTALVRRTGFEATARIERHEFGVSWQDLIPGGGLVVGNQVDVILDIEAVLLAGLG